MRLWDKATATGAGTARAGTSLGRLRRDTSGNTLAMMAIALIPVSALTGSAVDSARLYVVKVRLQQACDAGVLAGRKFMADASSTTLDTVAASHADTFFKNNFRTGWMGSTDVAFKPFKTTDNQVAATANATVPMTITKMWQSPDVSLTVTCEARFDVADTDIMFVLDTTGSMACLPGDSDSQCNTYVGKAATVTYKRPADTNAVAGYADTFGYAVTEATGSRMAALRAAVPEFWKTVDDNVDSSTKIRYGFVTYSSMVNAGKAIRDLSASNIVGGSGSSDTSWTYQSRRNSGDYVVSTSAGKANTKTQANCPTTYGQRTPATGYAANGTATRPIEQWYGGSGKCGNATQTLGPTWVYEPRTYNVVNYVAGDAVPDPSKVNGATARWLGCLEERNTTAGEDEFDIDKLPADLDPDLKATDLASRWRPHWPEVVYTRPTWNKFPSQNGDYTDDPDYRHYAEPDRLELGKNGCAKPVQRLKVMSSTDVSDFVKATDFKAIGGTYHDIGMIWGLRLLSPTGLFKDDTKPWPGRPNPKRVIVFFTDGDMAPSEDAYSVYGVEKLDRRVTGGDLSDRKDYHNARFLAACNKAKSMGIDVWTVAIAPSATDELKKCASAESQALYTTTGSGLSDAFKKIAKQVALLRVSK